MSRRNPLSQGVPQPNGGHIGHGAVFSVVGPAFQRRLRQHRQRQLGGYRLSPPPPPEMDWNQHGKRQQPKDDQRDRAGIAAGNQSRPGLRWNQRIRNARGEHAPDGDAKGLSRQRVDLASGAQQQWTGELDLVGAGRPDDRWIADPRGVAGDDHPRRRHL